MPVTRIAAYTAASTNRAAALHAVAEDAVVVTVGLQDLPRIFRSEVLEMQQRAGEQRCHRLDIPPDERVVIRAAAPSMPVAQIERVAAQCFVVGADIERHRDHPAGMDAGPGGVHGQLPCGGADAAAEVTDAGDLLGVAAHDDVDITGVQAEGGKGPLDVARPVDRQINPARAAVLVRVLPDRLASRPAVDDRQQFSQVIRQHLEIERLVAVMKPFQKDAPGEVARQ